MKKFDFKNKSCPIPVIETKKALDRSDTHETILSIVDNEISMQNIVKLASELNYKYQTKKINEKHYEVLIIKGQGSSEVVVNQKDTVIVIDKLGMGHGDDELGISLRKAMIHTLQDLDNLPSSILLYNSGVKIVTKEYNMVEDLKALENMGVEILSCGACIKFFGLENEIEVGSTTNMYEILNKQMNSKKVLHS